MQVIKLKSPVSPILNLEADELVVICYIFSEGFPEDEIQFDMRQHMLRRSDLYTLLPEKLLNSEVITAASYRAANYSLAKNGRVIWFLPAMLSIYIPMKDDNHCIKHYLIMLQAKFLYLMLNAMVSTDQPVVEVPRIIDFDIVSPENVPK
ncbi:hypothetical protein LINGRAHAP2_LOCUS28908 [Linum grandiflorum]